MAMVLIHIKRFWVWGFLGGERCGIATVGIAIAECPEDGCAAPLLCERTARFRGKSAIGMADRLVRWE
jgi:hypothetical protein